MKLTTKGTYALKALRDINKQGTRTPVRIHEIAQRTGISSHYLEQLFRKLRTAGIVKSSRGPGGGYSFNKQPEKVKIYDVLQAVGEKLTYDDEMLFFAELNQIVEKQLKHGTVASL